MSLLTLFTTFFKIGAFTFGGGYAMIQLILSEVVGRGWLTREALIDFIAVSESTPGPLAVNAATYTGSMLGGFPGALCATAGIVLPSFVIILLIAKAFTRFRDSKHVKRTMFGLKSAVVGLIAAATVSVGTEVFSTGDVRMTALSAVLFAVSAVLAFRKKHPILIICLCAVSGIVCGYAFGL